jgi:hypothetical protein
VHSQEIYYKKTLVCKRNDFFVKKIGIYTQSKLVSLKKMSSFSKDDIFFNETN